MAAGGAPTTVIALLRGINVGGHRVAMAHLRAVYESLGCTEVRTLLASGNVLFKPPRRAPRDLGRRIEAAFAERFGFAAPTAFVGGEQLGRVLAGNRLPMHGVNPSRFFVALPTDGDMLAVCGLLEPIAERAWAPEALALGDEAAYFHHHEGIHDSPLAKAVMRATRERLTMRNWATMLKLQAAAGGIA